MPGISAIWYQTPFDQSEHGLASENEPVNHTTEQNAEVAFVARPALAEGIARVRRRNQIQADRRGPRKGVRENSDVVLAIGVGTYRRSVETSFQYERQRRPEHQNSHHEYEGGPQCGRQKRRHSRQAHAASPRAIHRQLKSTYGLPGKQVYIQPRQSRPSSSAVDEPFYTRRAGMSQTASGSYHWQGNPLDLSILIGMGKGYGGLALGC